MTSSESLQSLIKAHRQLVSTESQLRSDGSAAWPSDPTAAADSYELAVRIEHAAETIQDVLDTMAIETPA